jgi:dTMP kinase
MKKPIFICFEGIDGSGKTFTAKTIQDILETKGKRVKYLHEPGSTEIGEEIYAIFKNHFYDLSERAKVFLANASRSILFEQDFSQFDYVLLDRYIPST